MSDTKLSRRCFSAKTCNTWMKADAFRHGNLYGTSDGGGTGQYQSFDHTASDNVDLAGNLRYGQAEGAKMLYRIEPNGRLTWTPQLSEKDFEMFKKHEVNLDRLDWEPVMESHDLASVVQVALRYGFKTPSGLAVSAQRVSALKRPAALRKVYGDLQRAEQHPAIIQADKNIEQFMPGWIEGGERNKDEVRQATENSIREAEAEAEAQLQGPVDDELVTWWHSRGGLS